MIQENLEEMSVETLFDMMIQATNHLFSATEKVDEYEKVALKRQVELLQRIIVSKRAPLLQVNSHNSKEERGLFTV